MGWEIMPVRYLIESWDDLSWLQKKRIIWLHWCSKMKIGTREIMSTFAVISLFFLASLEINQAYKFALASAIILLHFYILMFRKLLPN